MEELFLVVGLGNPGSEYARTRHNVGFMAVERCGARHGARWTEESRFRARLARLEMDGRRLMFCQPLTFMNESGSAVRSVADYFKLAPARLLVVLDDADLPFGMLRMKPSGGTGGHHGLESIEQTLGTPDYARLRIGIGRANEQREITGHVLGEFSGGERTALGAVLDRAAAQIECWVLSGVQKAMNEFNGGDEPAGAKEAE